MQAGAPPPLPRALRGAALLPTVLAADLAHPGVVPLAEGLLVMSTDWGVKRRSSGKFRHRVNIMRIPATLDAQGQKSSPPVICWPDVPCQVETLTGRSLETARALYESAEYRITIDYLEGVNTRHRLEMQGREFHIGHVSDTDLEHVEMVLLCSELR